MSWVTYLMKGKETIPSKNTFDDALNQLYDRMKKNCNYLFVNGIADFLVTFFGSFFTHIVPTMVYYLLLAELVIAWSGQPILGNVVSIIFIS